MKKKSIKQRSRWRRWTNEVAVNDARRKRCVVHDWQCGIDPADPVRKSAFRELRRIQSDSSRYRLYLGLYIAGLFIAVIASSFFFGTHNAISTVSVVALGIAMTFLGQLLLVRGMRARSSQMQQLAKRHGICSCCGYDLYGLPKADDGCRECPECSAAWVSDAAEARGPLAVEPDIDAIEEIAASVRVGVPALISAYILIPTSGELKDDQGTIRSIVGPDNEQIVDPTTGERNATIVRMIRRSARPTSRVSKTLAIILLATIVPIIVTALLTLSGWSVPASLVRILDVLLGVAIFGSMVFLLLEGLTGYKPRRVRDRLLRAELCPCCISRVKFLQPQSDGCIICPSCGSAWRAERIKDAGECDGRLPT